MLPSPLTLFHQIGVREEEMEKKPEKKKAEITKKEAGKM
jgi:hypothetical protein